MRGMAANPEELLEKVSDRDSFIAFVFALASEREEAEEIERREPKRYSIDGALNWKNGDIANYLYAALDYFEQRIEQHLHLLRLGSG